MTILDDIAALATEVATLPASIVPGPVSEGGTGNHPEHSETYRSVLDKIVALFELVADEIATAETAEPFNILAYGGNPLGFESGPALRAVCAAACAAVNTGAVLAARIVIPDGNWLFNDYESLTDGIDYIAVINASNITVDCSDAAVIRSTVNNPGALQIFLPYGGFKDVDPSDFNTTGWEAKSYTSQTVYPMNPANKYQREIVVPGGVPGLTIGDWIYIRGGLVATLGGQDLPDCELNQVTGIAGTTISLRWALAKPYVAENETGTFPQSAPGAGGAACPLGISVVTDLTIENFKLTGGIWDTKKAVWWALAMNIHGCDMVNMRGDFGWCAVGQQAVRRGSMIGIHGTKNDPTVLGSMIVGTAFGATDILIDDVQADGPYPCMLHIHEGSAQVLVTNVSLTGRASATGFGGVSIRGRNYDTRLLGGRAVGGSGDCHLFSIDQTCVDGGEVSGWTVGGNPGLLSGYSTIGCVGTGWNIHDCETEQAPLIGIGNRVRNLGRIPNTGVGNVDRVQNLGERIQLNTEEYYLGNSSTLPGATPSLEARGVNYGPLLYVASLLPVSITNILDGYPFEQITLQFTSAGVTLVDLLGGGRFALAGHTNWTATQGSTITLYYYAPANVWYEISRSVY